MPPLVSPRADDGPACRVCGCTRHNACPVGYEIVAEGDNIRERGVGCSWVETSGRDTPRWLCSACSGTGEDLAEVLKRSVDVLQLAVKGSRISCSEIVVAMAHAARARYEARLKLISER